MSDICAALIIIALISLPILIVILIIRAIMRKSIKVVGIMAAIVAGSIVPLTILGAFTDPATWCEHEYEIIEEVTPTCVEKGKVVKVCPLCEKEETEQLDVIAHKWSVSETVEATCVDGGYTVEKCEACASTQKVNETSAKGHSMTETSRIEATQTSKGTIVLQCGRCEHTENITIEKLPPQEVETSSDWKTAFSEKGFTADEIASYEEILTNVGITDYHDVEIIENGAMHIIRGKIFNSDNLQVNMTLENRNLFYVELAGIPAEKTEAYINWRGNIKFKTVQTTKSVELYYDIYGGYVAKLDWANRMISPYEEEK